MRSDLKSPKVFGIGFHKTATTSLADALEILGYHVTGPNAIDHPNLDQEVRTVAKDLLPQFDAFQDNPWPLLYQELDQWCRGSKFILSYRPTEQWIKSIVRHFGGKTTPMREWIYGQGDPLGHEKIYTDRYETHNREVQDYFQDRPKDLLILDITAHQGWEKLCPFLEVPIPEKRFPHANQAKDREDKNVLSRIYRKLTRHLGAS